VRWIKPAVRCSPSQTCGHLILSSSQIPANNALKDMLYICHKKVYMEKCKRELLRCLKCHRWNHMAMSAQQDTIPVAPVPIATGCLNAMWYEQPHQLG